MIAALAAAVMTLIGLAGLVLPVIPAGSLVVGAGALVWAIWGHSPWGWVAFGIAAVLLLVGSLSSLLLTSRSLQRNKIPKWPIAVGILVGLIGVFVLPGFGLPIGFAFGLLVAEWYRVRSLRTALATSWQTLKALGLGILIEFTCAMFATAALALSIVTAW